MKVDKIIRVGQLVRYKQWNGTSRTPHADGNPGISRLFLVIGKQGRYVELAAVDDPGNDGRRWADQTRLSIYV